MRRPSHILVVALLWGHGCGPEVGYQTLAADAERYCANLVVCEELPDPDDYADGCENEILDNSEVALDEGTACARAFEALVHCFVDLSCDEYRDWIGHHANGDPSVAYPCDDPTVEFLDECARTWFAPTVHR